MILRPPSGILVPAQRGGLKLWVSASDPANNGTQQANNSAVNPWTSKENGLTLNQGTSANQPLIFTNQINGRPVVRFDGTNDCLISNSTTLAITSPFTMFAVVKLASASSTLQCIVSRGPVATPFYAWMINRTSANGGLDFFDGTQWQQSSEAIPNTATYNFIGWTWDGSQALTYINLQQSAPTGIKSTSPSTAGNFVLGGQGASSTTNFYNGDIPEFGLYSGIALTLAQMNELARYFASIYGLSF
jgi:hypothetical protein